MVKETPHDYRIKLLKEELSLFKKYKVKKMLEVCSGDGRNIAELTKLGYEVTGIESKFNAQLMGGNVIEHPIYEKKFPFKDKSFDCVYLYQYLNHNYKNKIEKVFKEIYRVLKKRGLFSIKISDIEQFNLKHIKGDLYEECDPEFPSIKYRKIAPQTFVKLSGEEKGIPHYGFYQDELVESLEKIGFKLINIRKIRWNLVGSFQK
jgi:ubiquinone/menaquinone biosynthesis C-methylase UbiE